MKLSRKQTLLVGSLLFGLFFGAGNLIFPVHMGQLAGNKLLPAVAGFLITATGLPFLGVVAIGLTASKSAQQFAGRLSPLFGYLFSILLYLTLGPLFALPRTATVSFEVGLTPILSPETLPLALAIFTVLFFSAALFFALRPAKILDWVGKILNPIFLGFLCLLFFLAMTNPMGSVSAAVAADAYRTNAFAQGFIAGYQTMDALAALIFGSIIVETIHKMGITDPVDNAKNTIRAGLITMLLMCLIYAGLAWLGTTSTNIFPISANGGIAWAEISRHYLGGFGSIFLALTITLACLKTAIGLITTCAQAFCKMFPHILNYRWYCIIFAGFSCIVANIGLTQIIALAEPMLMLLYPPAITLILLSLCDRLFHSKRKVYQLAVAGSLLVGVVDGLAVLPRALASTPAIHGIVAFYSSYVPFFTSGFGWVLPALVGALLGIVL